MYARSRDMHGNGIPNGTGNPMGMGISKNGNGDGREWELIRWEC